MDVPARHLLFYGSIIFLIALLCRIPYGMAITKKWGDEAVRRWKLAHGALSMGATSMIGVAAVLSNLQINDSVKWILSILFIISVYSFCGALTLEPIVAQRGLSWSENVQNNIVFIGNVVGALSSLIGAFVLVYASFVSLW